LTGQRASATLWWVGVPSTSTVFTGHWFFGIGVLATPIARKGAVAFEN
jgi:hypothetical protein